jgi:putative FmdB family regulatory protein
MPIYEYQCASCGARRELILKPGEQAKPSCAACRKPMRRIISPTAFILKGSGWYVTDYPSQDRKKGMEAEKGGGGATETAPKEGAKAAAEPKAGPGKPAPEKKKARKR